MLTPNDLADLSVDLPVIESARATHISCGGDSLKVAQRNSWRGNGSADRVMQKLWTGHTVFRVKRGKGDDVAVPSIASTGGEGSGALTGDDESG